jgi:hypothetical protein
MRQQLIASLWGIGTSALLAGGFGLHSIIAYFVDAPLHFTFPVQAVFYSVMLAFWVWRAVGQIRQVTDARAA